MISNKHSNFNYHGWAMALILVSALFLSGCGLSSNNANSTPLVPTPVTNLTVVNEGRLVPADSVWVGFQAAGEVAEILVEEGQTVAVGDPLARLTNPEDAQAEVDAAQVEVTTAQQALDSLKDDAELSKAQAYQEYINARQSAIQVHQDLADMDTSTYQDKIDDAWTKVQDAQDDLDDAQETFDKYKDLDSDNTSRKTAQDDLDDTQKAHDDAVRAHDRLIVDLEQLRANANQADQSEAQAKQEYENRLNGPDPDQLALAEDQLASANAQLAAAQKGLDLMTLTAPQAGTITDLNLEVGQVLSSGQTVVQIADFNTWFVETTDLDELKVVDYHAGQPVSLSVDAVPDLVLSGEIERISLSFLEKSGDILYTARIRVNESDVRLRWGMTVEVRLDS